MTKHFRALKDNYLSASLIILLSLASFSASAQPPMYRLLGKRAVGGCAYMNQETCDFITKVTNGGGTLSSTEKNAVDTLVTQLKDSSLWSIIDKSIYPMVGGTEASCAVNLRDTTQYNLTTVSGTLFYASTGVTVVSSSLNTGINPLSVMSNTSGHLSFYSRTNFSAGYDIGCADNIGITTKPVILIARYTGDVAYGEYGNGSYATSGSVTNSQGFFQMSYESGVSRIYKNGTSLDNTTESCSLPNQNIYLMGVNGGGTQVFLSPRECAYSSVGAGMTTAQAATYYLIVQAFQTRLTRQV